VRPEYRLQLARCSSELWHQIDGSRYHLELCEKKVYQAIFLELLRARVRDPKDRSLALCNRYQGSPSQKRGSTGYDGYKRVKGNKLSAPVDRNGLPLACTVSPASVHDSWLYEPTLKAFEISGVQDRPAIISADAAYDAQEIRQYISLFDNL
jgi:hypothetical protein